jgi:RNase P/RNase MRP subunit p29
MRWPDIFFRARKRRDEQPPAFKPSPEPAAKLASSVVPTTAIKPASTASDAPPPTNPDPAKTEEPRLSPPPGSSGPALRPAAHASKPVVLSTTPAITPISTEEDPMKVFARANSIRLAKKADQAVSSSEPTPPAASESMASVSTPVEAPKEPVAEADAIPKAELSPSPSDASSTSATTGRRKAKLTDLARIIPDSGSTEPEPAPEPPSAVSPPAFTVEVPVGTVTQPVGEEKPPAPIEAKALEPAPPEHAPNAPEPEKQPEVPAPEKAPETASQENTGPASNPPAPDQASKSDSPHPSMPFEHLPAKAAEKKEFLLVNGERILGHVLSETPDTIYLDHGTLGVLTLPRSQIAARPIEIILINGDRIVGDIMAETPENIYVRHASLGMLTVPRAQRSARVVEAILKDGDRILGEVLAETENFTVIRSATLGTVPVPHDKIAMLNRKLEQVTLKALPNAATALEDKPQS